MPRLTQELAALRAEPGARAPGRRATSGDAGAEGGLRADHRRPRPSSSTRSSSRPATRAPASRRRASPGRSSPPCSSWRSRSPRTSSSPCRCRWRAPAAGGGDVRARALGSSSPQPSSPRSSWRSSALAVLDVCRRRATRTTLATEYAAARPGRDASRAARWAIGSARRSSASPTTAAYRDAVDLAQGVGVAGPATRPPRSSAGRGRGDPRGARPGRRASRVLRSQRGEPARRPLLRGREGRRSRTPAGYLEQRPRRLPGRRHARPGEPHGQGEPRAARHAARRRRVPASAGTPDEASATPSSGRAARGTEHGHVLPDPARRARRPRRALPARRRPCCGSAVTGRRPRARSASPSHRGRSRAAGDRRLGRRVRAARRRGGTARRPRPRHGRAADRRRGVRRRRHHALDARRPQSRRADAHPAGERGWPSRSAARCPTFRSGVASITNRSLPHLFPSADADAVRARDRAGRRRRIARPGRRKALFAVSTDFSAPRGARERQLLLGRHDRSGSRSC